MSIDKNGSEPLYKQIREDIRRKMMNKEIVPGEPLDTEVVLAKKYGVSIITVRNAILDLVNEGLLYRIRGKGTFVNPSYSSSVQKTNENLIAFVVPFFNELVSSLMEGIERITQVFGYHLVIKNSGDDIEKESNIIHELRAQGTKGLIVWPVIPYVGAQPTETLKALKKEGFPIVLVDQKLSEFEISTVTSDNFGGAYLAVTHLIERGCKRIGFITEGPFLSSISERFQGYRAALDNYNLPFDDRLVFRKRVTENKEAFKEYLESQQIDGLFIYCDSTALGVKYTIDVLGLKIPRDLKIVGFDDLESVRHLDVPLTTVAQMGEDIGAFAANLLFRQINGTSKAIEEITVPTRLVVRQSTSL